ncbi:hypothetical protein AB4Z51_13410 [Bradyrhizobium sp. 2TAF36]|uniref:hypothetical protein n=1 Tax=Bradyrhizobium sp. 2TAF36 TaxID=3233016 RepID=UPI003F90560D
MTKLKKASIIVDDSQYARLSDLEKSNIANFSAHAKRYSHRLALPLSKDLFTQGLQAYLEQMDVKFARIPFRSIDTVYYLFKDAMSMKSMMDFMAKADPEEFGTSSKEFATRH